ncbi:MAG: acyltransferase [Ferruginibacter sp.]
MLLNSSRIFGLDILRAAAILLVLLTHGIYYFTGSWDNYHLIKFIPDGVSVFFVLSGFLIGSILIKTVNKKEVSFSDLKNFWIRRWFRTLPAYYVVLLFIISCSVFMDKGSRSLWEYLKYFLFLQAFNNGGGSLYNESWSLCVEEFFYFFVPALLFFLIINTKFSPKSLLSFTIIFVIVIVTLYTFYKINSHQYATENAWDSYIRKTVFTRLNSIMYGFLGAYLLFYQHWLWKYKVPFFIAGSALWLVLIIRPAFNIGPFFNYEQLSLESLATLLLIPLLSTIKSGHGFLFKGITFISSISYSIYLVNFTPFYRVETMMSSFLTIDGPNFAFARLALFLVWSIGVGYLLYSYVERPWLKMRESFSHREYRKQIITT